METVDSACALEEETGHKTNSYNQRDSAAGCRGGTLPSPESQGKPPGTGRFEFSPE